MKNMPQFGREDTQCHPATAMFAFLYIIIHDMARKSSPSICEDILMRNDCMECFRSEAYWQVRRNDKNTKSAVYRKIDRKYPK